jgi:hypothetical protein
VIEPPIRNRKPLALACFGLGVLVFAITIHKHLSADGVFYFVHILEHGSFTGIAWARRHAEFLTQFPLVWTVKLGLQDVGKLVLIFGAGLLISPLLSFLLSAWALPRQKQWLLYFPIFSFIVFNLQGDYLLFSESHVLANLCWPTLFLIMRDRNLELRDWALLFGLLVVLSRVYETYLPISIIFGLLLALRLARVDENKWLILGAIFLCGASAWISGSSIIEPRSAVQKESFLVSFFSVLKVLEVRGLLLFCFAMILSIGVTNLTRLEKGPKISALISSAGLIFAFYVAYLSIFSDYERTAYWSFGVRTMTAWLLPLMILFAVVMHRFDFKLSRFQEIAILVACGLFVGLNLIENQKWNSARTEFVEILNDETRPTFVELEETNLAGNQHLWSWNNGLLSLVWSDHCVTRIIINRGSGKWAYDYEKKLLLTRYRAYGGRFALINQNRQNQKPCVNL